MRKWLIAILVALGGQAAFADPRESLATELADQRTTVDRALAMVTDKLATLSTERATHLRATYRALQRPTSDPMARARRTAALRSIVAHDRAEVTLLADEAAQLRDAQKRIDGDVDKVKTIEIPTELARPAKGEIARHYGTLIHERSKATLSRRGIDFEVDEHATVVAPARGVVRYAGELRGLESGIVIDHGSYYSVIGKLGDLAVPVGATVEAGDKIGRAARHRVYFEVRVRVGAGGMLIDPEPLLHSPKK